MKDFINKLGLNSTSRRKLNVDSYSVETLRALIRTTKHLEDNSPEKNIFFLAYSENRRVIEKATGKTWTEIKKLLY